MALIRDRLRKDHFECGTQESWKKAGDVNLELVNSGKDRLAKSQPVFARS
jgi:hypothetical protein